jgi:hypothetical protein
MKKMTADEWNVEGTKLFGKSRVKWKFRCPSCGGTQTAADFLPHKNKFPVSAAVVMCKGNFLPEPKIIGSAPPCRFQSMESKNEELILVTNDDGKEIPTLPFATPLN